MTPAALTASARSMTSAATQATAFNHGMTRWRASCCAGRLSTRLSNSRCLAGRFQQGRARRHDASVGLGDAERTWLRTRFTRECRKARSAAPSAHAGGYGPASAGLGYGESAALFAEQVGGRDPDAVVDLAVAMLVRKQPNTVERT